jgi:hypothetical protein
LSFGGDEPQVAVEQLLGLNSEEFFAAIFLHQETIRDFLTTTPEKRSATIDRMIGTYLLRTLIKLIDPDVPDKAIGQIRKALEGIDAQLIQASVLNREVILKKKQQYGDPEALPQVLAQALEKLSPVLVELRLPTPATTLDGLNSSLSTARQAQLERVSALTKRAGELDTLRQSYEQAVETNWHPIREQKAQFGDPDDLAEVLRIVRERLVPICQVLSLAQPGALLTDLETSLSAARRAQPTAISRLEQEVAGLNSMQERYNQVAVTDWQKTCEHKAQWGDPDILPSLLTEIQGDLNPILQSLELASPQATLSALEESLAEARRALPVVVGQLERRSGELLALKNRYLQASQEVVEDLAIPPELIARRSGLQHDIDSMSRESTDLKRQLDEQERSRQRHCGFKSRLCLRRSVRLSVFSASLSACRLQGDGVSYTTRFCKSVANIWSRSNRITALYAGRQLATLTVCWAFSAARPPLMWRTRAGSLRRWGNNWT